MRRHKIVIQERADVPLPSTRTRRVCRIKPAVPAIVIAQWRPCSLEARHRRQPRFHVRRVIDLRG
jgi:hypothetical protein